MKVTSASRRNLRLQNTTFVVLFLAVIGLLAWLGHTYSFEADWTAGNRNTLSEASRKVLQRAQEPITITAYARDQQRLRQSIRQLVDRYRRSDAAEVTLKFVNPDAQPRRVREMGITRNGEMVVAYRKRTEKVSERSEQAITNAIQRLLSTTERRVLFLAGHGERKPQGQGREELGTVVGLLEDAGIKVERFNLAQKGRVPEDASALVIADPRSALLDAEVQRIIDYVKNGGRLLWLADKDGAGSLKPLAESLGVTFGEGVVVDPRTRLFGISDPTRVLVSRYPGHPLTQGFAAVTMFPGATGVTAEGSDGLTSSAVLKTAKSSWLETGAIEGTVRYDQSSEDRKGPVQIAVALSEGDGRPGSRKPGPVPGSQAGRTGRERDDKSDGSGTRVLVTGDSDFMANAYVGEGGNRELALKMFRWVASADRFVSVPPQSAPGTSLQLSSVVLVLITVGFLAILPVALLGAGVGIWLHRRRL